MHFFKDSHVVGPVRPNASASYASIKSMTNRGKMMALMTIGTTAISNDLLAFFRIYSQSSEAAEGRRAHE